MPRRVFTCRICKNTYESDWTEEEAAAEFLVEFGYVPQGEDKNSVCDTCYEQVMRRLSDLGLIAGRDPTQT